MRALRRMAFLRFLTAGAVPLLFLFISVVPALAATPGSIVVTKDCTPRLVRPGQPVTCLITVTNLGTTGKLATMTDILAGGGLYPDTTTNFPNPPAINQLNRQQYGPILFYLNPLLTQTVIVNVVPFTTRAACINSFSANLVNEVHFDLASAPGVHIATARASFSVSCNARPAF